MIGCFVSRSSISVSLDDEGRYRIVDGDWRAGGAVSVGRSVCLSGGVLFFWCPAVKEMCLVFIVNE